MTAALGVAIVFVFPFALFCAGAAWLVWNRRRRSSRP